MSKINFSLRAKINQVAKLIRTIGQKVTVIVFSEPGVGKTSLLGMLAEMNGDQWRTPRDSTVFPDDKFDYVYIDCPTKEQMDIAANIPNHTTRSLEYYVAGIFKLTGDTASRPKVIMLDEFAKAPKLLQVIFTRMMLERMVGDIPLPLDSVVFGTSNNTTDGVGDAMLAHAGNRVCKVSMQKPDAFDWNLWAGKQNPPIARSIRSWLAVTPKAMFSYLDLSVEELRVNELIFNPKNVGQQYVSPRSLAMSSEIVSNKDVLGEELMMAALSGTIGEAAARAMSAFIMLEDKRMPFAEVIKNPTTCKVPDDVSVLLMMMMEAIDTISTHDELGAYMEFVNRVKSGELVQSIFFTMMMRGKPLLASRNAQIKAWAQKNHLLLG
jgi:hypothetical protein